MTDKEKIADLEARLKKSFQADDIAHKQELTTLKTNIARSLALQYEDYLVAKDTPCSPDDYECLLANMRQIFRTLKRYGVDVEKECK